MAEVHQREREQRNELQEFAVELERMRDALVAVASSPADLSNLSDQTRRMRASLGVVKARASQRGELASATAALDDRATRLFEELDAIAATKDPSARALKAATLLRELEGASPQARPSFPSTPTMPVDLMDVDGAAEAVGRE